MATTGKFNGDLLILDIDGNTLAHSTDATLTISQDAPDTTTKDSSGWKENLDDGNRSWEMSASGLLTYDAANTAPDDLADHILNNTSNVLKFTTGVTGDIEYSGTAKLTSISMNSPQNGPVTFEVTYQGNGALASAAVA